MALGDVGGLHEEHPGQLMDLRGVAAMLVDHEQAEIVAGMRHIAAGD